LATPRTFEAAVVVAATLRRFVKGWGCENLELTLGKNLAVFVEAQASATCSPERRTIRR
jgi:hypothetical protein